MKPLTKLSDIVKSELHHSPICIRALVSGKSTVPYKIPKRVAVRCTSPDCEETCSYKVLTEVEITVGDERVLTFIDIPTNRIPGAVKKYLPSFCKYVQCEVLETQNVLRVFINQPVGEESTIWTESRTAYFIGPDLDANCLYNLSGYSTVDPIDQSATFVFTEATKAKTSMESFVLSSKLHARLKVFQQDDLKDSNDVMAYLGELYGTYARNITKIYERFPLHLAVDMVCHSALELRLPNGAKRWGRLDAIVIGDTGCGKTEVSKHMTNYFAVGEFVGAENCSYSGLVGGVKQVGKHWMVSWGRLPMNDKGMVVIEEASEFSDEDWTQLSRVRSEGIAEITKIVQGITNARTRLLFLSNPPSKAMQHYGFGVHALADLVHAPEDIARFDFACVVTHEEVPFKIINSMHTTTKEMYTRSLERDLILWIWSRTVDKIIFTDEAVQAIFDLANQLGKRYDIGIPLIQGETVRFKIAKLAVAFAGRLYSEENDGEILLVKKMHIDCVQSFFAYMYRSASSGYMEHSIQQRYTNPPLTEESIKSVIGYFKAYPFTAKAAYNYMMAQNLITQKDLMEHLNIESPAARELISTLINNGCITKYKEKYVKTTYFRAWLRDHVKRLRLGKA